MFCNSCHVIAEEAITKQLPEDNVAKPCADMALMDPPEPLSLDARDEQAGLIVSELKAGKFLVIASFALAQNAWNQHGPFRWVG